MAGMPLDYVALSAGKLWYQHPPGTVAWKLNGSAPAPVRETAAAAGGTGHHNHHE